MPTGAIIGGVAALASAGVGLYTANKAADAQKDAAKKATKAAKEAGDRARADLAPYAETGKSALYTLADMYGLARPGSAGGEAFSESALEAFRNSPDYQVALKEGIRALDQSAAARGNLLSGGQIKAVQDRGAEIGSMYFDKYLTQLARLAGAGQNAASGQGSFAMITGNQVAQGQTQLGEAKASGWIGGGNAVSGAIDTIGSSLALNQLTKGTGSAYGGGGSSLSSYYNDYQ